MKDVYSFLTDSDGRCYYVQNGRVQKSAQLRALPYNPGGLTDIAIGWERKLADLGITRNFSAPLQFHQDSALILKEHFYNRSAEEKLFLLLHQRRLYYDNTVTPAKWHWQAKAYYKGEVDPTSIKHADVTVTASIAEGGLVAQYTANKGTAYEFPLEDPDAITVRVDGLKLGNAVEFTLVGETVLRGGASLVSLGKIGEEGKAFGLYTADSVMSGAAGSIDFSTDDRYCLLAAQAISGIRVTGELLIEGTISAYRCYLRSAGGREIDLVPSQPVGGTPGSPMHLPFDVTFDMAEGERFFLLASQPLPIGFTYQDSRFKLQYKSQYEPTFIKMFRPDTLFRKLAGKVVGAEALAASALLQANTWPCLTSGDGLRGLTGAVLKTSLEQFKSFVRAVLAGDIGIEAGKLIAEAYAHFLDTANPIDVGPARGLTVTTLKEELVNTVKIGYEPQDIDDVNGRYAFNNTHTYTSGVTRVQKELTLVCPYVADPYVIEIQRINFEGKSTTDSDKDNKVMLLDVDLDNPQSDPVIGTYYNLRRPALTITGVPDPDTIFNVMLSPKRLLLRQRGWIASLFYGMAGAPLTFTTTERNRELKTVDGTTVIEEQADFPIPGNPLFIPKVFDFDTEVPADLVDTMEGNPNRCFGFTWNGYSYYGFPLKVGIAPVDHKVQAFKLLCAPTTNLQNLITHG